MANFITFCLFTEKGDKFLIEEVLDCGPAVDLEQSPGCQLVISAEELKDKQYPDCCPVYDCPEGADVVYVNPKKDEAAN